MVDSGTRLIDGPAGQLEVLVDQPRPGLVTKTDRPPRGVAVLAHPHPEHGGTMRSKVVYHMAKGFSRIGYLTLRFNFRGVGRSEGAFDDGAGEADDYRAVVDYAAGQYPGVRVFAAGYSFGAWIALTTGAADPRVAALVGVAPPLNRNLEPVQTCRKPKFLIHGERDELAPLKQMWRFYATLPEPKELVVIDAADHLFDGKTSEVGDTVVDLLEGYQP